MSDTAVRDARRRKPRRARLLAAAALALAVLVGWVGWQWWTHPDALDLGGAGFSARPSKSLAPLYTGIGPGVRPDAQTFEIQSLQPHLVRNDAHATIEFLVCSPTMGDHVGEVRGSLRPYCVQTRRTPTSLRLGPKSSDEYLVMSIRPSRPGVSRVVDVDVSYRYKWHGIWRHGTDKALVDSRVTVTG